MTDKATQFATLLRISPQIWSDYYLANSRHSRSTDFQKKYSGFRDESLAIGRAEARRIKEAGLTLATYLAQQDIVISPFSAAKSDSGQRQLVAEFTPPREILFNEEMLAAAEAQLEQLGLTSCLAGQPIRELILAHETFHLIEELATPPLLTRSAYYRLYKGFPFVSHVRELSEIGGMAFAQAYFELTWSPFCLNYIFKLLHDADDADLFYHHVTAFQQRTDTKA